MKVASSDLSLLFIVATAGMLILAFAIVMFVIFYQKRILTEQLRRQKLESDYQAQMLRAQMESQEDERRRVAKDLHDEVGLMIQALRTTTMAIMKDAPDSDKEEIQTMVTTVDQSIRRICWDLMPSSLERFGLTNATDEMCQRLSSRNPVKILFNQQGEEGKFQKSEETLIYRMVQELVGNGLKHASAESIQVNFNWGNQKLNIQVVDDGKGFDGKAQGKGLGLLSLRSRADLLKADISFEKAIPQGTQVSVSIPLTPSYAEN